MKLLERWVAVFAAVLLLSGCIKVDQTLTIEPNGSGTLDMEYGMSEQTVAQLEAMKQMSEGMSQEGVEVESKSSLEFDEEEIRNDFADKNLQGVKLLDVSSESRDGWKYMKVKLAFDNLDALKKTEFFEDSDLTLTKNADGNYVLAQKLGSEEMGMPGPEASTGAGTSEGSAAAGGEASGAPDMGAQMMQGMAAMFAGLRIAMTVVVPGEIIESNATQVEGNRASWVYDIDKDPQVLTKLGGQDKMRIVFSGKDLEL